MATDSTTTPADVRRFVTVQLLLNAVFLVVVFVLFGGVTGDFPGWGTLAVLLVALVVCTVLAERVWLRTDPLDPGLDPATARAVALETYSAQTIRRLALTEVPLLLGVLLCFVTDAGGWPALLVGVPGLAVMTWQTWPSLRSLALTATVLEEQGASSGLVDAFVEA